jgi:hypothetical protein
MCQVLVGVVLLTINTKAIVFLKAQRKQQADKRHVQIFKPSNAEVVFTYSVLTTSLGFKLIAIDSDFVGSESLAIYPAHCSIFIV